MFWLKPGGRGGGGGHQGGKLAGWVAGPQSLETKMNGQKGLPEATEWVKNEGAFVHKSSVQRVVLPGEDSEGIPVHYPALGRPYRRAGQYLCPRQAGERN